MKRRCSSCSTGEEHRILCVSGKGVHPEIRALPFSGWRDQSKDGEKYFIPFLMEGGNADYQT